MTLATAEKPIAVIDERVYSDPVVVPADATVIRVEALIHSDYCIAAQAERKQSVVRYGLEYLAGGEWKSVGEFQTIVEQIDDDPTFFQLDDTEAIAFRKKMAAERGWTKAQQQAHDRDKPLTVVWLRGKTLRAWCAAPRRAQIGVRLCCGVRPELPVPYDSPMKGVK